MKSLFSAILKILKFIGRFFTIIRNTFLNIIFILILLAFIFPFLSFETKDLPVVQEKSILRLDISGKIVEQKKMISSFEKLFDDPFITNGKEPETVLQDILDIIDSAADDDNITVLLLNLKNMGRAGLNQLETIGEALNRFKESGKPVIAAEDYYTQSQYFLASYADTVIVNPMGGVDIHGMGVFNLYFKEALDKLEVNYNIFKVGSYKSALEPITRKDMSAEDRQQNELWLTELWSIYSDTIVKNRLIEKEQLINYTNNISEALSAVHGNAGLLAKTSGLVDHIWSRGEIQSHLAELNGSKSRMPKTISSTSFFGQITPSYTDTDATDRIGIIIGEGTILPGKRSTGMIGSDSLAKQIRKARKNQNIKGLVIRLNTGGGSALASEIIRQEIKLFKKSGKPVVVSMGTITASGGYWIAADADEIWAQHSSITGSIGVFGAIPTFEKSLASIGIYSDGIGTTPLAAGLNVTQPLPPTLKTAIQQAVEFNYERFLKIVSDGRDIPPRKVAELAKGRVYDGKMAKSLGLIDKIGDLAQAVASAADLASLTNYDAVYIYPPRSVKDQIISFLTSKIDLPAVETTPSPLAKLTGTIAQNLQSIVQLHDPQGVYAYCELKPQL